MASGWAQISCTSTCTWIRCRRSKPKSLSIRGRRCQEASPLAPGARPGDVPKPSDVEGVLRDRTHRNEADNCARCCHPEGSEGSGSSADGQILHFVQEDRMR